VIRIQKAGYIYILLTILIGFAAVNTGNNLIYIVTSALLSHMLISGIFGRKNIQGLEVDLTLPEEIYAENDAPVEVKLLNTKTWMPAFLIKIAVDGSEVLFPFVRAGSSESKHILMRFPERGRKHVGEITISSVFPFNFFTRYRRTSEVKPFLVFAKPLQCSLMEIGGHNARWKGDVSSNTTGYESELISIRDYISGDHPKYINWKSTAKTGNLKTKELSSIELQHVMINFDTMDKRDLEFAVSCITYNVLRLMRSQVPVGMTIAGETIKPGLSPSHKIRILTRLALYVQSP
jgi:uncharacterized protein (DUF58 family)